MIVTVMLLLILVQVLQMVGDRLNELARRAIRERRLDPVAKPLGPQRAR